MILLPWSSFEQVFSMIRTEASKLQARSKAITHTNHCIRKSGTRTMKSRPWIHLWLTSRSTWSTMLMIEPPPSQGLIRQPLGNMSALTKHVAGGPGGPPVKEVRDLSHICKLWTSVRSNVTRLTINFYKECPESNSNDLPQDCHLSKVVVFLSVHKSRADANVVGA